MDNYYEILEVTPFSSVAEIKHSFRQKAKLLHPDVNSNKNPELQNVQMAQLVEAYKYLLEKHKSFVDAGVFTTRRVKEFNYRQWLMEREDYASRAKLIVFDLFHNNEQEAVAEYLRLLSLELPFYFVKYFSRVDFMDYGFLLAEELFFEHYYYESFELLKEIIVMETEQPYFLHFFPEVISLTKKTLNGLTPSRYPVEQIIQCYNTAMSLNFPEKQKKAFSKRIVKLKAYS